MSQIGKKALREEARKADAQRVEQLARRGSSIIPERPQKHHANKYLLILSKEDIDNHLDIIRKIIRLTHYTLKKYDEGHYSFIRENLPFALSYARCTEEWKDVDDTPDFCAYLLQFLEEHNAAMNLRLSKECTIHLVACASLAEIYGELSRIPDMVGKIIENCGGRETIEALVAEVAYGKPGN